MLASPTSGPADRQPAMQALAPPSTANGPPVMYCASSEARNTAALAMSQAVPIRPIGVSRITLVLWNHSHGLRGSRRAPPGNEHTVGTPDISRIPAGSATTGALWLRSYKAALSHMLGSFTGCQKLPMRLTSTIFRKRPVLVSRQATPPNAGRVDKPHHRAKLCIAPGDGSSAPSSSVHQAPRGQSVPSRRRGPASSSFPHRR